MDDGGPQHSAKEHCPKLGKKVEREVGQDEKSDKAQAGDIDCTD